MYGALHAVQSSLNYWCQCGRHGRLPAGSVGERLKIDLLWFSQDTQGLQSGEEEWIAPVVAIEHENDYTDAARSVDHWKVSQVAALLRVFIGYTRHGNNIDVASKVLRDRESRWRPVPGGEALIILGHSQMQYGCFRAWWARQGQGDWKECGNPRCACP